VQWDGEEFMVTAGDKKFSATVVCGSWGKRSNIDVKWQRNFTREKNTRLNNYVGIKYHVQGDLPNDVVYLHNFTSGYCGVSPVEDDKHCVCYLTTANALRRCGNDIKRLEQEILSRNKWLRDIFRSAKFVKETPLAISQISFEKKEQVHDHVLLVGDAAGMITPLCGNGMTMAFHSATLADALIELFLRGHITRADMERGYVDSWNRAFASRTAIGRAVQNNFGKDSTTALFLTAMKHITPVRNAIVKKLSGEYF
jgi:flavin-dependent dehydrogenase